MNDKSPLDVGRYIHVSRVSSTVILVALSILAIGLIFWCSFGSMTDREHLKGVVFPIEGTETVYVPNDGFVRQVFVHKGDIVEKGQPLALISIGESYSILSSTGKGIVLSYIQENEPFKAFESIVDLLSSEQASSIRTMVAYANFSNKRFMQPGQEVQVTPANETRERIGFVRGTVKSVAAYPVTRNEAIMKLQNPSLVDEIFPDNRSVFEIEIELNESVNNPSGLDWSFPHKEAVEMGVGTFCNIDVIVRSRSLFKYLFENVQEKENAVKLWGIK